jgi:galactosylceramidase
MSADRPWSGHYKVWPAIWACGHTTQFAEPGWQYLDGACGRFFASSWKGTFVTLKNRDTNDWSMVICTDHSVDIKLKLKNIKVGPVHVWRSDSIRQFIQVETLRPASNTMDLHLHANSLYTLTTSTGQQKGFHAIPADRPFPFPYKENYDSYAVGSTPRYHSDQKGTFAVAEIPGRGRCLQQLVPRQGYLWQYMTKVRKPYTVFGDQDWQDYSIAAEVKIQGGDVELGGRFGDINKLSYRLVLNVKGEWSLAYQERVLASGNLNDFDPSGWHGMKLSMSGSMFKAFIDDRALCAVSDTERTYGMAYLASSYDANCFDDIQIQKP